MSGKTMALVVAGYTDLGPARRDFDAVTALVRSRQLSTRGMILVSRSAGGEARLEETGDDHGHVGRGWRAGVGVLVGLYDPVMLGTVVVGSVGGRVMDVFTGHRLRRALQGEIGPALAAGTAAFVGMVPPDHRPVLEAALPGARAVSAVDTDIDTLTDLEVALADALVGIAD